MQQFIFKAFWAIFLFFSVTVGALEFSAGISLDDAVKQINAAKIGKVLSTKTETIEGKSHYVIKVLTPDGLIQYIKIDVATGKVIE